MWPTHLTLARLCQNANRIYGVTQKSLHMVFLLSDSYYHVAFVSLCILHKYTVIEVVFHTETFCIDGVLNFTASQNQDKMRPNTTTFSLFAEQHVSTKLGHLQVYNSYSLNHIEERKRILNLKIT
jgi:hypothetical protein